MPLSGLYDAVAGNPTKIQDLNQLVDSLTGKLDPGAFHFAAPVAAPGAPGVTLTTGTLTGSYQWCAWWVTGVPNGSNSPVVNATTAAGTATGSQALSSQAGVIAVPGSPPSQAVGFGIGRTKNGGSAFYVVTTIYLQSSGTWPSYTDNTPDSSLTTPAPSSNTTGSPVVLGAGGTVASGQTLAMAGAYISGGPTLDGGALLPNAVPVSAKATDGTTHTVGELDGSNIMHLGDPGVNTQIDGAAVQTAHSTLDDGSGNQDIAGTFTANTGGGGVAGLDLLYARSSGSFGGLLFEASSGGTQRAMLHLDPTPATLDDLMCDIYAGGSTYIEAWRVRNSDGVSQFAQPVVSTVAQGTAPFSPTSTTECPNLNAQFANLRASDSGALGALASGSYTGTGATQSITTTFAPKLVVITGPYGGGTSIGTAFLVSGQSSAVSVAPGNSTGSQLGYDTADAITAGGFSLAASSVYNYSGSTYHYVAIG